MCYLHYIGHHVKRLPFIKFLTVNTYFYPFCTIIFLTTILTAASILLCRIFMGIVNPNRFSRSTSAAFINCKRNTILIASDAKSACSNWNFLALRLTEMLISRTIIPCIGIIYLGSEIAIAGCHSMDGPDLFWPVFFIRVPNKSRYSYFRYVRVI